MIKLVLLLSGLLSRRDVEEEPQGFTKLCLIYFILLLSLLMLQELLQDASLR